MTSADTGHAGLEVAVIGMACRFPGASSVEAFWDNLRQGRESISFFTTEELRESGVAAELLEHPGYVRAAGILDDVERFDARFFGFTAREAQALDPQHRLFLELAWEAMERAGYDPHRCPGSVGVFAGSSGSAHYWKLRASPHLRESISSLQALLSTDRDFLSSRVAYKLNLTGPAVTVQTACSTSLAAVHLACQSLLAGECDLALAGGASAGVPQRVGYLHEPDGVLSRDGHCRAFDARSSGTVKGSGAGIAVLKRLPDALRDRDRIVAVIKGWAMNNDGAQRVGFTAPGLEGQARVVRLAQAMAGVEPESIGYVEAHGTGTALGDPIEIAALSQAFGGRSRARACAVGSVKTNIGHLDAAAGIAAFIKTVLMLQHRELVPSLHFEAPNPKIDFANGPFYVATRTDHWPSPGTPRRAGVTSLGMGGTNVHVVLEESPPGPAPEKPSERPVVLVVSAPTLTALERSSDNLARHLEGHPELNPADVAFTLSSGRHAFAHRRAVVCRDLAEGARSLVERSASRVWTDEAPEGVRPVAFLFTGQGAQYVNMARGLYQTEPAFRAEVDSCCDELRPHLGLDLRLLLYPEADALPEAALRLNETRFTQPALFTIEHALVRLWASWGVVPQAMLGHSVGEYVAACVSGVMTRDQALALVAERARLMQSCPPGALVAVALGEDAIQPLLSGSLALSVVNGPESCVVGGPIDQVESFEGRLRERDVPFGRVPTSHAFHSSQMEPALAPFSARVARVRLQAPRIPFVSNLTGTWITPEEATDPVYWTRHLRQTVRFSEGLGELLQEPGRVLLEVGPGPTLISLAKRRFAPGSRCVALASVRHLREDVGDDVFVRLTAARLWAAGSAIDWAKVHPEGRQRVLLPSYPFEGQRYSVDTPPAGGRSAPAVTKPSGGDSWLYVPSWRRTEDAAPAVASKVTGWCVFADGEGLGDLLAARLRADGARVSVVRAGTAFARMDADEWVLDPSRRVDFVRVLDDLEAAGGVPHHFVHLGNAGEVARRPAVGGEPVSAGFLSVLRLAQALGPRQSRETILTVVSTGAVDVTGLEPLSPERAALLGLCRVIPQEYPLLSCHSLDVDAGSGPKELVEQIRTEAMLGARGPVVAHRGRYRWAQSFETITAPTRATPRLRPGGVYLITGGLGKVGLALAEHLARVVKARLVLTGRNGLPEPALWDDLVSQATPGEAVAARIGAVRGLEALGAEVLVVSADVADQEQMGRALALARHRFGGLDGVIHAAGEVGPGVIRPLVQVEGADCERQLRPKLCGAEVLDSLLGADRLDFVLLTSSLSTVLGGVGYSVYAAANHSLDAFARRQHQRGRPWWISVDWDGWRFAPVVAAGSRATRAALSPREGREAFARVLGLGLLPQVVVSASPLPDRLEPRALPGPPAEMGADEPAPDVSLKARPDLHTVYATPEGPVERRLAEIWGQLLGVERIGLDDNFFELGGSSLLAVHLMGRLRKEFSGDLSVTTLFDAPTVRALSRVIQAPAGGEANQLASSQDRGQMRRKARQEGQGRTSDAAVE